MIKIWICSTIWISYKFKKYENKKLLLIDYKYKNIFPSAHPGKLARLRYDYFDNLVYIYVNLL